MDPAAQLLPCSETPAPARALPAAASPAAAGTLEPWLGNYSSPHTQCAYRRDALLWDAWCADNGVDLLHPLPGHVSSWISHRRTQGDGESTILRRVSAVLAFYRWARHEQLTTANPTPFRRPKAHRDAAENLGLTREELLRTLACAGSARYRALISLLGGCGLRISEALGAGVADLRERSGHRTVRVTGKGEVPRVVPIPPWVWRALTAYLGERGHGPLFATASLRPLGRSDAYRAIARIGDRAGIPGLHPHTYRHTAATLMLEAGAPLDRVQLVLGHADPRTTMAYAKARDRLDGSPVYDLERLLAEPGWSW